MSTKKFKTSSKKNKEAQLSQQTGCKLIHKMSKSALLLKEYTEPVVLNVILQNATGEYNKSGGSLAPIDVHILNFSTTISGV